jgi:hypothetical protein
MPRMTACAACGSTSLRSIYSVSNIPVHSVLLMNSAQGALDFPRGDLELGFCDACGFVQNLKFDPAPQSYSKEYEETQHFSATFDHFARGLAQDLVDRHDLHGKKILEIGCGKGEFLVLLCELGGNSGTGLDPGYHPERTTSQAASRIEFINDFYDERYTHLEADVIVCRHTLEHIQPVRQFMESVRRTIGDRRDTLVFFELPAVERVLQEGAFWDVYYEHASYFSLGSLARLFRATGFEVTALSKAYDDQYLLIEALPAAGPTGPSLPEEDDLEDLRAAATHFSCKGPEQVNRWRAELEQAAQQGQKVALWGSGSKAVSFLTTIGVGPEVGGVVDINPHKHGRFMPGTAHPIWHPKELQNYRPDLVIVMNPIYLREIGEDLSRMGLSPRMLAV